VDTRQETHQEHQDGRQDGLEGEWLGVVAAAARLGVTPDAIRRRVRRKTLHSKRVPAEHGGAPPYLVWVPADALGRHQEPRQEHQEHQEPQQDGRQDVAMTLAAARAHEMAEYTAALIDPWRRQVTEQAERIGHLEERCATLQAQLAAATNGQAHTQNGAGPEWPDRRRWWQRLIWG
jgi:hypothetical protein